MRAYNVNYVIICTGVIKHNLNPYLLPCRFVCNVCSITTITVCTLIHNNNIMYNNIDCKVSSTTRLAYRE